MLYILCVHSISSHMLFFSGWLEFQCCPPYHCYCCAWLFKTHLKSPQSQDNFFTLSILPKTPRLFSSTTQAAFCDIFVVVHCKLHIGETDMWWKKKKSKVHLFSVLSAFLRLPAPGPKHVLSSTWSWAGLGPAAVHQEQQQRVMFHMVFVCKGGWHNDRRRGGGNYDLYFGKK